MADDIYVVILGTLSPAARKRLRERGWEVAPVPSTVVAKHCGSEEDEAELRDELEQVLAVDEDDEIATTVREGRFRAPNFATYGEGGEESGSPLLVYMSGRDQRADVLDDLLIGPGGRPAANGKQDGDTATTEKSTPTATAATPTDCLAALVEKGLPALTLPHKVWDHIDNDQRATFAYDLAGDLYAARMSYARRVGWVLSPELELLDLLDRQPAAPAVTRTKTMATEILQTKIDRMTLENASARADVALKRRETQAASEGDRTPRRTRKGLGGLARTVAQASGSSSS